MSQTRIYTVSDLVVDLLALKLPHARVNLMLVVPAHTLLNLEPEGEQTVNGPAESLEKVWIQDEGPAVVLKSNHGVVT